MSKSEKRAKPPSFPKEQEKKISWEQLRNFYEQETANAGGIKRFSGKHRPTYLDPTACRPDGLPPAEQATQMISALLRESSSLSRFFQTLSEQILELGDQQMSGADWREFLANLHGIPQNTTATIKQPPKRHPGEDRFGYKPFKNIVPDKISGLDCAWRNVLSIQADTGLPFDKSRIKQLEQTLMGGLGIPLPLNELGISEKWQKAAVEGVEHFFGFHIALQEYGTILGQFLPLAISRFDTEQENAQRDPSAKRSIRELYLDWLTACEFAYQQITETEQYGKAYGNLINAFVALRQCGNGFTERMSGLMNLPTQRDLDTSHFTQHQLRNGYAEIREQLDEVLTQQKMDEIEQKRKEQMLFQEMEQLKEQVSLLRQSIEGNKKESSSSAKPGDKNSDFIH